VCLYTRDWIHTAPGPAAFIDIVIIGVMMLMLDDDDINRIATVHLNKYPK